MDRQIDDRGLKAITVSPDAFSKVWGINILYQDKEMRILA